MYLINSSCNEDLIQQVLLLTYVIIYVILKSFLRYYKYWVLVC